MDWDIVLVDWDIVLVDWDNCISGLVYFDVTLLLGCMSWVNDIGND